MDYWVRWYNIKAREVKMENKGNCCIVSTILRVIGVLLLLAAAFDILPLADNQVIFIAIACFIIGSAIRKIQKGSSTCCK